MYDTQKKAHRVKILFFFYIRALFLQNQGSIEKNRETRKRIEEKRKERKKKWKNEQEVSLDAYQKEGVSWPTI